MFLILKTKGPGQMRQRIEKEREDGHSCSWNNSREIEPEIYLVLTPSNLAVEMTSCVTSP